MKVKGHPDLRRTSTGAIVNVNQELYTQKRLRKRKEEEQERRITTLEEELEELRNLVKALRNGQ